MGESIAKQRGSLGPFARRPAVAFALLLIAGILLHPLLPRHPLLLILVAIGFLSLAILLFRRPMACFISLGMAVILTGIGVAQREHFQYPHNQIGLFAADESRLAQIECRLMDEPQTLTESFGQMRPLPPRQIVNADVLRVKTWDGWTAASGQLPITIDQPVPHLAAGQIIRAFGLLQRPAPPTNPGQFDWAAYYRQQRILATFTIRRAGNIEVLQDRGPPPISWLRLKARRLLSAGFSLQHTTDTALLQAIFLGDRDPPLHDIQNEFQQIGLAYQLSVSGLHIAILAGFVFWLCRVARLRPRNTLLVTTAFVALYAAVALPSHSGVRSVVLCAVIFLATWNRRPVERFQLLGLAVILLLLWHPLDLYSAGFQLSFTAVLALAIYLPRLRDFLRSLRDPHQALAPKVAKPPLQAGISRITSVSLRALQIAVIVWVGTLPLIVSQFGQLNPWALPAGILLLPFVLIALLGGLIKVVFTLLLPGLAGWFAAIVGAPVVFIRHGVHALAHLPGASVPLPAPPVWVVVAYYLLLLVPLLPSISFLSGRRRWFPRAAPFVGVIMVLVVPLFPRLSQPLSTPPALRITLLAVGAGQCAVIEPPDGKAMLFDAGSSSISDLVRKVVGPFLRTQGEREVDDIFLSHGDYDHISAAGEIASVYGVHAIFTSPHFRRNADGNAPDQTLLETFDKLDVPPRLIAKGDHLDLGQHVSVDVLWPPRLNDMNSNNAGLVLRLTYAGRTILFPADIQDPALQGVLNHPTDLKADVLIAPHHGSSESLTPAFLQAVDPHIILSSNGWRLTNKQKRFNTMAGTTPLYRTSKCGAITLIITPDGRISVETFIKCERGLN